MSGSALEALLDVRESLPVVWVWSRDPPRCLRAPTGCLVVVECLSRMSDSGREALPNVREWLGGSAGCPGVVRGPSKSPGVVRRPTQMSGSGRRPSRMSGSGREDCRMSGSYRKAIPNVREYQEVLPDVRARSGSSLECPGVVERPSWMPGCGREALPDDQEWSRDHPRCQGGLTFERASRTFEMSSRMSGRPSRMFERPIHMFGSVREALWYVRE